MVLRSIYSNFKCDANVLQNQRGAGRDARQQQCTIYFGTDGTANLQAWQTI
jgi:hypothetical protein